jgi:hypothetical protein
MKSSSVGAVVGVSIGGWVMFAACQRAVAPAADGTGGGNNHASSTLSALTSVGVGGAAPSGTTSSGGAPSGDCKQACAKYDTCAKLPDACGMLGVDCDFDPIHESMNIVCILRCIGDAASECKDIGDFVHGTALPGPGSKLIRCISACNRPPVQPAGQFGGSGQFACFACLTGAHGGSGHCVEHLVCNNDADCTAWLDCAKKCGTPSCYAACDAGHPKAASHYQPFYACVCKDIPSGEAVKLWTGKARCVDVCAGIMDPCAK